MDDRQLIDRIRDTLGTEEDGEALVHVVAAAHAAEVELAALAVAKRMLEDGRHDELTEVQWALVGKWDVGPLGSP